MLFHSPTQFAILALLLFVGWLFGLASRTGGAKWRRKLDGEREAHASYRTEIEGRLHGVEQDLAASRRRVRDLEGDLAKTRPAEVVDATADADVTPAAREPLVLDGPRQSVRDRAIKARSSAVAADLPPDPAETPVRDRPEWLQWGAGDDLARIRGIERSGAARLRELGIKSFKDIEALSPQAETELEVKIGAPGGYIARNRWREQAVELRAAKTHDFQERKID